MPDLETVEYRVRPVTRYIVTRHYSGERCCGCDIKGEFDNPDIAHEVAYALCKDEHQRLGWPPADERITYPRRPNEPPAMQEHHPDCVSHDGRRCDCGLVDSMDFHRKTAGGISAE